MVAAEEKYHLKCVTAFYRQKPKLAHEDREEDGASSLQATTFAELVAYIESFMHDPETASVLSMPNLCRLYVNRLKDLGLQFLARCILGIIPGNHTSFFLSHYYKEVVLMFNKDLGNAIKNAYSCKSGRSCSVGKLQVLVRPVQWKISGRMSEEVNASSFKALVAFILDGPATTEQSHSADNSQRQAILTISQLLAFNCRRKVEGDGQEQSVPLFDSTQECQDIPHLPEKYRTFLPALASSKEHLMIPECHGP
ncbi:hypothetical protein PoB_005071800 [Plakobranchus ocellatus]|uniref:Uncharacterized protein n=1 Tax=Plakobranchus ocellatus TaxID=259542 RepID=A0AAV4BYA0_9GAST|nr:hypothetical protein PoB_005071800 [Plakobranchus ocellatus]